MSTTTIRHDDQRCLLSSLPQSTPLQLVLMPRRELGHSGLEMLLIQAFIEGTSDEGNPLIAIIGAAATLTEELLEEKLCTITAIAADVPGKGQHYWCEADMPESLRTFMEEGALL